MKESTKEFIQNCMDNNVFDDVTISDGTLLNLLTNVGVYNLSLALYEKDENKIKKAIIYAGQRLWDDISTIKCGDCVDDYKWYCELFINIFNQHTNNNLNIYYVALTDNLCIDYNIDNEKHTIILSEDDIIKETFSKEYKLIPEFEEV